jgi:PAS domain-containing protein
MTVDVASEAPQNDSTLGLGDQIAGGKHGRGAVATCAVFAICAALSAWLGLAQGPQIKLLLPVTATIWSCADMLTGYVLVGQFCFTRRLSFAVLAVAYMLGGYLTWAYLGTFPGFNALPIHTLGDENVFVYCWMIWHWIFPVLVVASIFVDSPQQRIIGKRAVRNVALVTIFAPLILTCLSLAIVFIQRDRLPYLVIAGHLQPLDRLWFQPAVLLLNAGAISVLFARSRRLTVLHLWLAVAMFATCVDTVLITLSAKIYSYAWDVGKLLTVATAGTILTMIIGQVVSMYRQQFQWAKGLEVEVKERKRAEVMLERAAIAARAGKIGIWHWDAISDARFWDDTLFAIFGRQQPIEPIDSHFFITSLHPDDRERVVTAYTTATGDEIDQEYRVVWENGEVHYIRSRGMFVRAENGAILQMTGAAWDVTALRLLTIELQAEKEHLAGANRLLSMAEQLARVGHCSGPRRFFGHTGCQ